MICIEVPNYYLTLALDMPVSYMKNANPRYTNRHLRRGGGGRKSTIKYLTMKRRLDERWSAHEPEVGANELIASGHTPSRNDTQPHIRRWSASVGRRYSKRSGKKRRTTSPHWLETIGL